MKTPSLDALRRHAVARSLFPETTLQRALDTFGFVQADPIRAPARAQDLTLRHRVKGYRAGVLEQRYATLRVEEDFFINYGFVTPRLHALMHPRGVAGWPAARRRKAEQLLAFVQTNGTVHPREVEQHFAQGRVINDWGGSSHATTHLLDKMHYAGLLTVVRRERGVRVYGARAAQRPAADSPDADARLDALVDVLVGKYAPLPGQTLSTLVRRLRYAVPQLRARIAPALQRATARLGHARLDGVDWYWPAHERPGQSEVDNQVRFLAPFDPIVWDRRRFELFWGWAYRFEAYTPVATRTLGYYALPMLWRDRVIGWANVSSGEGTLRAQVGYVSGRAPAARGFAASAGCGTGAAAAVSGGGLTGSAEDRSAGHPRSQRAAVGFEVERPACVGRERALAADADGDGMCFGKIARHRVLHRAIARPGSGCDGGRRDVGNGVHDVAALADTIGGDVGGDEELRRTDRRLREVVE